MDDGKILRKSQHQFELAVTSDCYIPFALFSSLGSLIRPVYPLGYLQMAGSLCGGLNLFMGSEERVGGDTNNSNNEILCCYSFMYHLLTM